MGSEKELFERKYLVNRYGLLAFSGCSPLRWQPLKASKAETINRRPFAPLFLGSCTKARQTI